MHSKLGAILRRPALLIARLHQQRHQALDVDDFTQQMFLLTRGQIAQRPTRYDAGIIQTGYAETFHRRLSQQTMAATANSPGCAAPGNAC